MLELKFAIYYRAAVSLHRLPMQYWLKNQAFFKHSPPTNSILIQQSCVIITFSVTIIIYPENPGHVPYKGDQLENLKTCGWLYSPPLQHASHVNQTTLEGWYNHLKEVVLQVIHRHFQIWGHPEGAGSIWGASDPAGVQPPWRAKRALRKKKRTKGMLSSKL